MYPMNLVLEDFHLMHQRLKYHHIVMVPILLDRLRCLLEFQHHMLLLQMLLPLQHHLVCELLQDIIQEMGMLHQM